MNDNNYNQYISSGDFAKLCGVNKQTLLYYDKIHLFTPDFTDSQGYRYYTFLQLDVFSTILALKAMGLSLQEIKQYINSRTANSTKKLLQTQINELHKKMIQLETISSKMKKRVELVQKAQMICCNRIYVESHERQLIKCSPYISPSATEKEKHTCLGAHINYRLSHQLHCGHAIGGMVRKEFLMNPNKDYTFYSYYFTIIENALSKEQYSEKPAGNYLVLYHKGHYSTTFHSYPFIIEYALEHHLSIGDYAYEESLIDEISESDPSEYITQISVPFTFIS